jgi:hypothetical protein
MAEPVVNATGTGLMIASGFTGVGSVAQLTQAFVDDGASKKNVAMASLTLVGLGATDDLVRLGRLADDFQSGVTALRQFDIDFYGAFNTGDRARDALEGHELLQFAWLKAKGLSTKRGVGSESVRNPAMAVSKALHVKLETWLQ